MGKIVRVDGATAVQLPSNYGTTLYLNGMSTTLRDDEYTSLSPYIQAKLTITSAGVTDPVRPPDPDDAVAGVSSVNGLIGDVILVSADIGAVPTDRTVGGHALVGDVSLVKADVGLGNVDNTSDVGKPISTAQQTALNLKAPSASPAFTGTPTGLTKSHVGLGNVDNTADSAKSVSTAQAAAIAAAIATLGLGGVLVKSGTYPTRPATTLPVFWAGNTQPSGGGTTAGGAGFVAGLDFWMVLS